MSEKRAARFDIDAVRELAGAKVFARGESYHRDGQVAILGIEAERVLAQVAGTENYRIELNGRGTRIEGECSCPAFDDWGFCKHMVATALAVNSLHGGSEAEGAFAAIREHLKAKGIDSLVAMIMDLAARDPALFRRLDMAAAARRGDDKTVEARLRKAIDGATRTRGYIDYREAQDWANGVDSMLDAVADLVPAGRAVLALALIERAIDRIERAVESIDDSDGHCTVLLERAAAIHLDASRAARPDPVTFARELFAHETTDEFDTFVDAAERYAEVLGEPGLAEYRRLALAAWNELPPVRKQGAGAYDESSTADPARLARTLDFFAERDGDVEARIAIRARHLASPWDYLQLAEFCLAQGREEEALRRAQDGLWMFEDAAPDERLVFFAVDRLLATGRDTDALAQLWRAFEKQPSLALYQRLRPLGGTDARDRAVRFVETALAKQKTFRWHSPGDLLVYILTLDDMFDAAWAALRKHAVSAGVREALATASEATHPREALEIHTARVERLAEAGGNPAYAQAAALVARMAGLRSAEEQAVYLVALKLRFGRRRNFMKLLG